MEPRQVVSLCPECGACPEVRVYEDRVVIGEGGAVVELGREAWNRLVDSIQRGELSRL